MKLYQIFPVILLFCITAVPGYAQVNGETPVTLNNNMQGMTSSSQVFKDPRVDLLIQKQVYLNTLALRRMPGYRVQVISTIDRNKATATRARLMQLFPDYQSYLSYQSPYFRVRIGDFRSQQEAQQLQEDLNSYFPNGVFTVRDYIHITPDQLFQNSNDNDSTR